MENASRESGTPVPGEAAKELLLEDFRYFSESFWRNEQVGETRVNYFVSLVTAVVAALVALMSSQHGPAGQPLKFIVVSALTTLFCIGLITLERILKRNKTTDEYKRHLDTIRQMFRDFYDPDERLSSYRPLPERSAARAVEKRATPRKTTQFFRWLAFVTLRNDLCRLHRDSVVLRYLLEKLRDDISDGRAIGGLSDFVAAINAFLAAGIVATVVYCVPLDQSIARSIILNPDTVIACAALAFLVAWGAQRVRVVRYQANVARRIRESGYTHEFALVTRQQEGRTQYLLVSPSDRSEFWVLPKGHIEDGEKYGETASREVKEEAGVLARVIDCVGEASFKAKNERVSGRCYLMEFAGHTPATEKRLTKWLDADEIAAIQVHPETRYLLNQAEKLLAANAAGRDSRLSRQEDPSTKSLP